VHSATNDVIALFVSGQSRGFARIELAGCDFFFGEGDAPHGELMLSIKFGVGISIITEEANSLWLLEIVDSSVAE